MKTIEFLVSEQKLAKGRGFGGLARGSENYIRAKFTFSADWKNAVKIAEFSGYAVLIENGSCMVPSEALARQSFTVRVVGQNGDMRITTNTITIRQEG